jgi:hypothetical protein
MLLLKLNPIEPPWYGPVCPVVWEGRRREVSPYPDHRPTPDLRRDDHNVRNCHPSSGPYALLLSTADPRPSPDRPHLPIREGQNGIF